MRIFNQYKGLRAEIYILFICKLIDNAGSMVGPMLTLILSSKLGLSAKEIAIISTICMLVSFPANIIGGKICDKFPKKLILNVCDIMTSLIYIICGIIGINCYTIAIYYIGSVIQMAESATYESLVADFSIGDERERASSLLYLGLNLGLVLAPTIGGFLLNEHCQLLFIISGVSQLLSIIIFDIYIKDTTALVDESNKYEEKMESGSLLTVLKENKVVFAYMVVLSLSWFIYNMWGYLLPISLTDIYRETGSIYYGTLSSLNCIVVVLCTVPITNFISNMNSINKSILGNILELCGYLLILAFINIPFMFYIAITVFTFGEITNTISTTPHLTKRIPMNYRGRILSLSDSLYALFTAIGEYAIGYIYDGKGIHDAWIFVFILGLITIIAYQLIKKPDKQRYPDLYKK